MSSPAPKMTYWRTPRRSPGRVRPRHIDCVRPRKLASKATAVWPQIDVDRLARPTRLSADDAKCHRVIEDLRIIQELMCRASHRNALCRYTRSVFFHRSILLDCLCSRGSAPLFSILGRGSISHHLESLRSLFERDERIRCTHNIKCILLISGCQRPHGTAYQATQSLKGTEGHFISGPDMAAFHEQRN